MTLPPRVEPTGAPPEPTKPTTPPAPTAPQPTIKPPRELYMLKGDLVQSINSIISLYRTGEVGDEEVAVVLDAAEVIRGVADGV